MPINPAYRGFLKALDAIEQGADAWLAYERHYLNPHREALLAYWERLWGVSEERLPDIAAAIRLRDYRALRDSLQAVDVEAPASAALTRCAKLIDLPEPQVDLLVGRFSPDAFLFQVTGEWHIGVGLERFAHFASLPLFIAHEYGHYVRRLLGAEPTTLGDRVVAEGMAVAFAQSAYPEQPLTRHLRMSARRVHEIREIEARLWAALRPHLGEPDGDEFAGVVSGGQRWMGYPPRFGACLGYWAVWHFAQSRQVSPASREVLSVPAEEIIAAYGDPAVGRP